MFTLESRAFFVVRITLKPLHAIVIFGWSDRPGQCFCADITDSVGIWISDTASGVIKLSGFTLMHGMNAQKREGKNFSISVLETFSHSSQSN